VIIGRGLVAKAFAGKWPQDGATVIVAAGVSNSDEREQAAFDREKRLLDEVFTYPQARRVVYFGSCAVGNPDEPRTPYLRHKTWMESRVLADERGRVFRLPQVVGEGGNPHTLTNFLSQRIQSGEHFEVWVRSERNLIDVEDVVTLVTHVLCHPEQFPRMMPLADAQSTRMPDIVHCMERALAKRGNYSILERGAAFPIDTTDCLRAARACGIHFGPGYLEQLVEKYYGVAKRVRI